MTQTSSILVSFNQVTGGSSVLALIDVATSEVRVLRVPERISELGGVTGLAASDRYVYAMTPRSPRPDASFPYSWGPSYLLVFDRHDLTLRTEYRCSTVFAAHSICADEGSVYVVSTDTDEVVRIELREDEVRSERPFWRLDPNAPRIDVHHLNSICRFGGGLLLSGFGKRSELRGSSAKDGFVLNLTTGEWLASGIYHPHSVVDLGGRVGFCESARMVVRTLGDERSQPLPGYARGLCQVGDSLFVGTSRGRRISKSSGLLANLFDFGAMGGRCTVTRLCAESLQIEQVIDLDDYAWEIYDLLPVENVDAWPVATEHEWRNQAIRGFRAMADERDHTIVSLHEEVRERDAAIARLQDETAKLHPLAAEQHVTIDRLHGEVAARDETIARLEAERADLLRQMESFSNCP